MWFDVAEGRLGFAGRVTRHPIREWLATADGTAAVAETARQVRFSVLGRTRSARRRIDRELWQSISAPAVREDIAAACREYVSAWTPLAYAPSLPRVSIDYRRMVVVPRVMIVSRIAAATSARLTRSVNGTGVPDAFRVFFAQWVLAQMDDAVRRAEPSPRRPLQAQEPWACVALDTEMVWVDLLRAEPDWRGHVVLFEMPTPRLPRRQRQELEAKVADLLASLPNLSRQQRDRTVRLAVDQMASVRA